MCVTPSTTSWSPAGVRSDMVRRKLTCVGARGGNVYKWYRWPEKKKPDEKKIGIDQGAGSLEAERRTEKEEKKMP